MRNLVFGLAAIALLLACQDRSTEQDAVPYDEVVLFVKECCDDAARGCAIKPDSLHQIIGVEAIPAAEFINLIKIELLEEEGKYKQALDDAYWFKRNGSKTDAHFNLANMYKKNMLMIERYLYHTINTLDSQKPYGYQVLYKTPSFGMKAVYIDGDLTFIAINKDALIDKCSYLYSDPYYLE